MFCFQKALRFKSFKEVSHILDAPNPVCIQVATIMKLKKPPNYDHVELPERRRLKMMERVPQPWLPTMPMLTQPKQLWLMRGPEKIHNRIIYGEFGIQAITGGRLRHAHLESIRLVIIRKMDEKRMFAHWRVDPPWQPVTKKGLGHRMGGGKGSIDRYEIPIKPDRMIMELGGKCEYEEAKRFLTTITKFLPFESKVVTRKSLEEDALYEAKCEKENQNPFTFKYCSKNNFLGIRKFLSPYEIEYEGKYR